MRDNYDFCGYATKNDLRCSDGRTIRKDAFKHNDGQTVPLVWNHQHDDPNNVLGHALLENRANGVYVYGTFNDTETGQNAKELVRHGDIKSLSIFANKLKQNGGDVLHGDIREVSLVLAGANPGAMIDSFMAHSEDAEESAYIYVDEESAEFSLSHNDDSDEEVEEELSHKEEETVADEKNTSAEAEETVQDIIDSMNEKQKNVLYALVGSAMGEASDDEDDEDSEGGEEMKHNVFANEQNEENVLMHDALNTILKDGKKYGSLKESYLAHADEYGIESIDYLFPDAKNYTNTPEFIGRETSWVSEVMNGVHKSPFSKVKTMFADITEDAARAKGYIKGKLKKEEVFSLLKRSTSPTTIYKKQKLDRDDVIDITDFDAIPWIKNEMRGMLDEEIARAILIGDGRLASDDDHINTDNIRPVVDDADLFVIRWAVSGSSTAEKADNFTTAAIKARKNYKGSGNPTLFTTEDMLTDLLLQKDGIGHRLYKTEAELATALRVKKIVTVPVMEGLKDKDNKDVYGIIVNLNDYNVGADKGGAINMFDDFDIDYNQMKYLIETRCSGAMVKPFAAIVLRAGTETKSEEPTMADAMKPFKPQNPATTPEENVEG